MRTPHVETQAYTLSLASATVMRCTITATSIKAELLPTCTLATLSHARILPCLALLGPHRLEVHPSCERPPIGRTESRGEAHRQLDILGACERQLEGDAIKLGAVDERCMMPVPTPILHTEHPINGLVGLQRRIGCGEEEFLSYRHSIRPYRVIELVPAAKATICLKKTTEPPTEDGQTS